MRILARLRLRAAAAEGGLVGWASDDLLDLVATSSGEDTGGDDATRGRTWQVRWMMRRAAGGQASEG